MYGNPEHYLIQVTFENYKAGERMQRYMLEAWKKNSACFIDGVGIDELIQCAIKESVGAFATLTVPITVYHFASVDHGFNYDFFGELIADMGVEEVFCVGDDFDYLRRMIHELYPERLSGSLLTLWEVYSFTSHTEYGKDYSSEWYLEGVLNSDLFSSILIRDWKGE